MATVHLPPPSVRVTYSGLDLAEKVSEMDYRAFGETIGSRARTKGIKGADYVARLGAKVVLVEAALLKVVHGGCVEAQWREESVGGDQLIHNRGRQKTWWWELGSIAREAVVVVRLAMGCRA